MSELRPEVVAAGAEVIKAAVAYIEARHREVEGLALIAPYRRLENAVDMFEELTDDV